MRKLTLKTEEIMPLNTLSDHETEMVVGGTGPIPQLTGKVAEYSRQNCYRIPQQVANVKAFVQNHTNGCKQPPYSSVTNCTKNKLC